MALSNWDTLAFDIDGPASIGSAVNHEQVVVSIYKNWLNVTRMVRTTSGPPWRRQDHVVEEYVATVHDGELRIGAWSIQARRGPQNGIYVIADSARWDEQAPDHWVDRALLVGCGVSGYTDPTEAYVSRAIDLGVNVNSLMTSSVLDDEGNDHRSIVGVRSGDDGSAGLVTVASIGVPEAEWVGVQPESVNFLKALVQEHLRGDTGTDGWPGRELSEIAWDQAERCNQGDLFFAHALGVAQEATAPGEASDPLLIQALGKSDG